MIVGRWNNVSSFPRVTPLGYREILEINLNSKGGIIMKKGAWVIGVLLSIVFIWGNPGHYVYAAEPVILGVPTSLGFLRVKRVLPA